MKLALSVAFTLLSSLYFVFLDEAADLVNGTKQKIAAQSNYLQSSEYHQDYQTIYSFKLGALLAVVLMSSWTIYAMLKETRRGNRPAIRIVATSLVAVNLLLFGLLIVALLFSNVRIF